MNPFNHKSPHPLTEEELKKLLGTLPKFTRSPEADEAFFKQLRNWSEPQRQWFSTLLGKNWIAWPKLAFTLGFSVLLLFSITTLAAYQPYVTRGHFLYPWKQTAERVELAFAFSPLQKVETHVRFSKRRLAEAQHIVKQAGGSLSTWLIQKVYASPGNIRLPQREARLFAETLADMQAETAAAARIVSQASLRPKEAQRAIAVLEQVTEKQVETLTVLQEEVAEEIYDLVKNIAEETHQALAIVIEAKEELGETPVSRGETLAIKLIEEKDKEDNEENEDDDDNHRRESIKKPFEETAEKELDMAREILQVLPEAEKNTLEKKLDLAQQALEAGNFGKTAGLSRAVQTQAEILLQEKIEPPIENNQNDQQEEDKSKKNEIEVEPLEIQKLQPSLQLENIPLPALPGPGAIK